MVLNVTHIRFNRTIWFNCCSVYILTDQATSYFTDNNSGRLGDYRITSTKNLKSKYDRLRHSYLRTTESMWRMPKAPVNNRSNIIVGSCKQTILLYFQRYKTNTNFTDPCSNVNTYV